MCYHHSLLFGLGKWNGRLHDAGSVQGVIVLFIHIEPQIA